MAKSGTQRSKAYRDRLRPTKASKKTPIIAKLCREEYNLRKRAGDSEELKSTDDPLRLFTSTKIKNEECLGESSTNTTSSKDFLAPHTAFHSEIDIQEASDGEHSNGALARNCCICDRICFKDDLDTCVNDHEQPIHSNNLNLKMEKMVVCDSCKPSWTENSISNLMKSEPVYASGDPQISSDSTEWDPVSERLLEKWISNEKIEMPTLDDVTQFDGPNSIAEGVSVHQNKDNDSTNIATHNMDVAYRQINTVSLNIQGIGEICAGECRLPNGEIIIKAYVYILPNQPVVNIIDFIYFNLLPYTVVGAALLRKNFDKIPMILSGNFNINFKSDEARPLIEFMLNKFSLQLNTDPNMMTTKSYSSIDAVFQRYLDRLKSTVLISYFAEQKPIISCIHSDNIKFCE